MGDDQMIVAEGIFGNTMPWDDWGKSFQALMAQSIESFASVSWQFLKGAFTAGSFADGGSAQDWWVAVIGGTVNVTTDGKFQYAIEYPGMLNIMVVAMIPLFLIFVVCQVVMSVFRSSTAGMLRAFGAAILGIPATYVLGGLVFLGLKAFDSASIWIIEAASGDGGKEDVGLNGIYNLFGMAWDIDANGGKGGVLMDSNYQAWAMASNSDAPGQVILPWIVALLISIACLLLLLMMIFRTITTLVVTMFAPVAVFSLSFDAAKGVFAKWCGVILALLIAKPIAAGVVMFGVTMASIGSDWVQIVAGGALVLIAAAMPMVTLAIVGFMTPDSGHAVERAGAGMGASAGRKAGASVRGLGRAGGGVVRSVTRGGGMGRGGKAGAAGRKGGSSLGGSTRDARGASGGRGRGAPQKAAGAPSSTAANGAKPAATGSTARGSSTGGGRTGTGGGSSSSGRRDVPGVTTKPGSSTAANNRKGTTT